MPASSPSPYLASRFGGGVAVREIKSGEYMPESTVYRVLLEPDLSAAPCRVLRGRAVLSGAPESLVARLAPHRRRRGARKRPVDPT